MNKGKIFTLVLWAVLAANYFLGFSIWVNYFAALLLGIHVIEFIVFFKKIKDSNDGLIYGLFGKSRSFNDRESNHGNLN